MGEDGMWVGWNSAREGKVYAETITEMVNSLKALGPNPMKKLWHA